ncbi:hypothetical protein [Snuella sedimenti]|uniref:Alpha-L-rhamnosidase six-hairpin glycosidase domain-containing protein n=1 Tax=Snuella sedimenti TaxID=2798802 RepID=A0A8J7IGE0_9FLAO|nr:hypothetical protein [Snuella sedimenti]MBJ6367473.1 hypothetical protein [Snuella sedimenti]
MCNKNLAEISNRTERKTEVGSRHKYLYLVTLFLISGMQLSAQDLIQNGDFEYPITDKLSMEVQGANAIPGWISETPLLMVNHLRLFPYSNYQSILLQHAPEQEPYIRQEFVSKEAGTVAISFALAASRMENGRLRVLVDGNPVGRWYYSDFWTQDNTILTDHMDWRVINVPQFYLEAGKHTLEFKMDACEIVSDNQGDKRDMIEGFLLDDVKLTLEPEKQYTGIPLLDSLAGQWVETKTLTGYPALSNFLGSVKSSKCLGAFRTDFLYGEGLVHPAGTFKVRDSVVFSQQSKWFPYQIINRSNHQGVEYTSTMRLIVGKSAVLMDVSLKNKGEVEIDFPLTMDLVEGVLGTTNQINPVITKGTNNYAYAFANNEPVAIRTVQKRTEVAWEIKLKPGEQKHISYVVYMDDDSQRAKSKAKQIANSFDTSFKQVKTDWENQWHDVFTPGNKSYSGHLPIFETTDKNLYEIYYLSIASMLQCQFNNVYPTLDTVFATNNEWARSVGYFWEMGQFADIYALLEPKGMKQEILMWFNLNVDHGNALNYRNGQIAGHWYAVNNYQIFKAIDSYIRINQDFNFLKEKHNGKTVMEHLYGHATAWEKRFNSEYGLADYGDNPWSFFETNPDYIHLVPAMNAQNVWMLRQMAAYNEHYGDGKRAVDLRDKAAKLAEAVKSLYVPGEGVWKVKYPNGHTIVSRHSYDFFTIGKTMTEDLSLSMKQEMVTFVEDELLSTSNFMRAMSLKDHAALNSDRSDHGPVGCYIGWPPMTIQAIAKFGEFRKARNLMSNFRDAFVESGMGQAIEFLTPIGSSERINRIGDRAGASFLIVGANFANAIIDGLMGYMPEIDGEFKPYMSDSQRFFKASLKNVRYGNKSYEFKTSSTGVNIVNP